MNEKVNIKILRCDPRNFKIAKLIEELDEYQSSLYPRNNLDSLEVLAKENVCFVAAFIESNPIACGAAKIIKNYGELKRIFVLKRYRRKGIGRLIIGTLEDYLIQNQIFIVRLETGIYQPEAISLYKSSGYQYIDPFGQYEFDPLSVFMEKNLCPKT